MSDEQVKLDNLTPITRTWRLGGPMSAAQRKEAKSLFLDYLKTDHNITLACEYANVSRQTMYTWRERDQIFAEAWENAVERTKDIARSSIYQRAIIGWDEPLVSMGQPVYEIEEVVDKDGKPELDKRGNPKTCRGEKLTIHKWSDTLAIAYAKANLPEYKDKQQIDLNAQIFTMAEQAKDELLADLAAAITHEDQEQPSQE